jgi:hypothetical protein
MDASAGRTWPHQVWWRRLRRRLPFLGWWPVWLFLTAIPYVCLIASLLDGPHWGVVREVTRWLWFTGSALLSLAGLFGMGVHLVLRRSIPAPAWSEAQWWRFALQAGCWIVAALALSLAQMQWAVLAGYGVPALLNALWALQHRKWRALAKALPGGATAAAFMTGSPGLLLAALALRVPAAVLVNPPVHEVAAEKPSRKEFVQKELERWSGWAEGAP